MVAAGFVEFCAAHLLVTGKISARIAALILLFFFLSAIFYFGLIDAIGHAVIVVVLVLLALNDNPLPDSFDTRPLFKTAGTYSLLFLGTLAMFTALYSKGHHLLS